ncbi:DNA recombination protein RmuC [Diaphorobacter ruginosibacter]|uniref:DNA recombination protein RmuC n=1 Tax=Diaphorobacter ruginosibacter TaxID=1715720 RepID=A0A7G9RJ13_9BURK|nr:DNA recombination protein RmuC [Diaphorobacter ruginosibacter]QNN55588.1 DNA recombination protein RmuC [Diaphorobacter ruginosibacter]
MTPETLAILVLILSIVTVLLLLALVVLLLRKPRGEIPPELQQRLLALETVAQATQLAVARNDGAMNGMAMHLRAFSQTSQDALDGVRDAVDERLALAVNEARISRNELQTSLGAFENKLDQRLALLDSAFAQRFETLSHTLRSTLNERLSAIQTDNSAKLEEMRRTVDEKLHATLEQRLGESFKLVSERLEQVHKGLGEMQTLAGSVGDLKRVMTNVKSRGTWGEMQLGAIIDNVLSPEQYARNVKTVPGSDELVEFAIRLPGKKEDEPVWLPIDSKYPVEHYQRLLDASEAADRIAMIAAGNAFETSIRLEARKIFSKYVAPPHTTDFAVLYLPTEGLFAEVMRRPGLVEAIQNECRVMITGPANLAAMLNSLQMGFKTLAIEKRSSEVWSVLGQVKTEFQNFGAVVDATRKSIEAAARKFDQVDVRTRAIQRRLRSVQELPGPQEGASPLADESDEAGGGLLPGGEGG